jgi:putative PIN family toxin of toxin-antitoxin system
MTLPRIVIDTNVLVSAFLNPQGVPARVSKETRVHSEWAFTQSTLSELLTVILRSKFDRYASLDQRRNFVLAAADLSKIVPVTRRVVACRDPRDNHILEAAVNGSAAVIVTGDTDLLALHPFHGIRIVTPLDYVGR